jgi:hypothetical protein
MNLYYLRSVPTIIFNSQIKLLIYIKLLVKIVFSSHCFESLLRPTSVQNCVVFGSLFRTKYKGGRGQKWVVHKSTKGAVKIGDLGRTYFMDGP